MLVMKVMNPDTGQPGAGEVTPDKGLLRMGFLGPLKDTFTHITTGVLYPDNPSRASVIAQCYPTKWPSLTTLSSG
jgi:hypothetical protein